MIIIIAIEIRGKSTGNIAFVKVKIASYLDDNAPNYMYCGY